tara:strand:+ start:8 stop:1213 length:1206 start_codon:yes stop_codon:yes gene_type:complete
VARLINRYPILGLITASPTSLLSVGLLGLVLIFFLWALFYRVKVTANGVGLTAVNGRIVRVSVPVSARVKRVNVSLNQSIRQGDVLIELNDAEPRAEAQQRQQIAAISSILTPQQIAEERAATVQKISSTRKMKNLIQSQVVDLEEERQRIVQLLPTRDATQAELLAVNSQIDSLKLQKLQLMGTIEDLSAALAQSTLSAQNQDQLNQLNSQLSQIEESKSRQITAPISGLVSGLSIAPGDVLEAGTTVAQISSQVGPIKGIFLVPADQAHRIAPGSECLINPAESPSARFGFIKSRALSVGKFPTNPDQFTSLLGLPFTSDSLFQSFVYNSSNDKRFSAFPYLLITEIELNNNNPIWTTGSTPPWNFKAGSAASVQCIYDSWPPISYFLPFIRQLVGYNN